MNADRDKYDEKKHNQHKYEWSIELPRDVFTNKISLRCFDLFPFPRSFVREIAIETAKGKANWKSMNEKRELKRENRAQTQAHSTRIWRSQVSIKHLICLVYLDVCFHIKTKPCRFSSNPETETETETGDGMRGSD